MTEITTPRLVTYLRDGRPAPGVERAGAIAPVDGHASVRALLEAGPEAVRAAVAAAAARLDAGEGAPRDDVVLCPPITDPAKILCIGLNYADHVAETGRETPVAPTIFAKFANTLVGDRGQVVIPPVTQAVDYEGELAVVIGREARRVAEADALDVVAGYTIMNDVSARDLQRQTPQWTAGKAVDTFGPLGPGIVLADAVRDPQALRIRTRVNGATLQDDTTAHMIFPIARLIAFITSWLTLVPGDLIATGTPSGVGFARDPKILLRDGDTVEVEIESLGVLTSHVVDG